MTTPSPIPEKTNSGISIDPKTLDRVVPESRRPDGSIRKEIKIRPGYTPREDITRFRGTRQTQMDRIALPPGHILGWAAPSNSSKTKTSASSNPTSKSAKKNEKRKAKRDNKKEETIRALWDDDDETVVKDPDGTPDWAKTAEMRSKGKTSTPWDTANEVHEEPADDKVNDNEESPKDGADDLGQELEHLQIR